MSTASYEDTQDTLCLWDNSGKKKIVMKNRSTGQNFAFELRESFVVGRNRENCDLQIAAEDQYMSGKHLRFIRRPEGVFVEDLNTRNGTRVNGKKILKATRIRRGDIIRMGRSEFEIIL